MSKTKKPKLTDKQKEEFTKKFLALVAASSDTVQALWKEEGEITWPNEHTVKILPEGFEKKFKKKQASDYVDLMNKNGLLI